MVKIGENRTKLRLRPLERILDDIARVDPDLHRRLLRARKLGKAELRSQIRKELRTTGLNDRGIEALVGQLKKGGHP